MTQLPLIFEYGLDSPQFGSFLLSLVAAFLSCFLVGHAPSARRTGARVLAIALLAVLSNVVGGPLLLTGALLVFAAGDAFLAQDDDRASRLGLSCLLAGNVSYAVLFFSAAEATLYLAQPWRAVIVIALLVAVLMSLRIMASTVSTYRLPALAALAVSVISAVLALGTVLPGLMAGAILLTVFAALVAMRFGRPPENPLRWMPVATWVVFYAAHLLITLAALALL